MSKRLIAKGAAIALSILLGMAIALTELLVLNGAKWHKGAKNA